MGTPQTITREVPGIGVLEFPAGMSVAEQDALILQHPLYGRTSEPAVPPTGPPETSAPTAVAPPQAPAQRPLWTPFGDISGVVIGAAKGGAHTVSTLADLARQYVPGVAALDRVVPPARLDVNLAPVGTAQNIGYTAEQIGEFFTPGGAPRRAAAWGASKLVPVVARAPKAVQTLARVAPVAAAEGATAAAITGAQGGDPLAAGVVAAAVPVVGAAAKPWASHLQDKALDQVQKALGPTKERFKAMAEKVAPGLFERDVYGWLGTSRQKLLSEAKEKASSYGKAIDAELKSSGSTVMDTKKVVDALEEAKGAYRITREVTTQELAASKALRKQARQNAAGGFEVDVILDNRPIDHLTALQRKLAELGPQARLDQIVAVRRAWDTVVDAAGGYAQRAPGGIGVPLADQSEAWAKKQATDAIRSVLSNTNTQLADLNKEYAFWKTIKDVLRQTNKRQAPQKGGLSRTVFAAGGAATGAATGEGYGDKLEKALIYGTLGGRFNAAINSPRWNFASAKFKNDLAEWIASGNLPRIESALAKFLAGSTSVLTQDAQPTPSHAPLTPPSAAVASEATPPPPPDVLFNAPPGEHELSDGSVWTKHPNGDLQRIK